MASLAYPFADAAYGLPGVQALALCDLGNALAIFGVAYYLSFRFSRQSEMSYAEILKRLLSFVPLQATWIGLVFNLTGMRLGAVPATLIETLASANSPLMLISLGLYLDFALLRQESKALLVHTLFKYGAGAAIALSLTLALPYRGPQRAIAFLIPLLPAPVSSLVYSVEQSLNPSLAATLISLDILISLAITTVTILAFRTAF
jgi:predicted permease